MVIDYFLLTRESSFGKSSDNNLDLISFNVNIWMRCDSQINHRFANIGLNLSGFEPFLGNTSDGI